jgi:hypothetical protein
MGMTGLPPSEFSLISPGTKNPGQVTPMPGIITPNLPLASSMEGKDPIGSTSDVSFEEGTRKHLL